MLRRQALIIGLFWIPWSASARMTCRHHPYGHGDLHCVHDFTAYSAHEHQAMVMGGPWASPPMLAYRVLTSAQPHTTHAHTPLKEKLNLLHIPSKDLVHFAEDQFVNYGGGPTSIQRRWLQTSSQSLISCIKTSRVACAPGEPSGLLHVLYSLL